MLPTPILSIGRAEHDASGRKLRRCLRRRMVNRRHIVTREIAGYVHTYHATKGWRRNKL